MRRVAIVAAMLAAVAVAGGALATPGGGITDVISFVQGRTTRRASMRTRTGSG